MRIFLKIMGRSLYEKLTREMAALQSAFPKRYKQNKLIDWQLILLDEKLDATMLASEAQLSSLTRPTSLSLSS